MARATNVTVNDWPIVVRTHKHENGALLVLRRRINRGFRAKIAPGHFISQTLAPAPETVLKNGTVLRLEDWQEYETIDHVIGWMNWTGYQAVEDDKKIRWVEFFWGDWPQERIDRWFEYQISKGPKLMKPRVQRTPTWARDYQKSRVYEWEKQCIMPICDGDPKMTLDEVRDFLTMVCREIRRYRTPQIKDGRGCRHATGGGNTITLPIWARRKDVVLHELAHCMTNDSHGPNFVLEVVRLYARFLGKSRDAMLRELKEFKIDIAEAVIPRQAC